MGVHIARLPIFKKQKKIHAYELLFRTGVSNGFPGIDGNIATTSPLSSSYDLRLVETYESGNWVAFRLYLKPLRVRF